MRDDPFYEINIALEARESFHFFSKYMHRVQRRFKWVDNFHHARVADALTKVFNGEITRLIINEPPRYSKTQQAVVDFIAWTLGHVPDSEFIHTSYSDVLAKNNSYNARTLVELPEYKAIFPDVQLRGDSSAKGEWRTTRGGVVYATGSGGTITGFGAGKMREGFGGAIIMDDPHKPDEVGYDTKRNNVLDNYMRTIQSRQNNPGKTPIILMMQRLHEADLAGFLLDAGSGEEWHHICFPAIYQDEDGEDLALWPQKHSLDQLRAMEKADPYMFAGQYMQRPSPLGGGIFKDSWWGYWNGWQNRATWPRFRRVIQSWDTAFKTGERNDYSVCITFGETETHYHVIDIFKAKLEAPDLQRATVSLAAKFTPSALLIEDKASGQGLIQTLRSTTRLPVIAVPKDKDKVFCANSVSPYVQAGRFLLPEGHPEVAKFVHSLSTFPNGLHDDDVDGFTQGANYLVRGTGGMQKAALGGV